jgi:hypothetical protein
MLIVIIEIHFTIKITYLRKEPNQIKSNVDILIRAAHTTQEIKTGSFSF